MGRYNPWRHLRSLPDVELEFTDDERVLDGADARYFDTIQRIVIDRRIETQVERRCVAVHELGHALRRDLPCGDDRADDRQEAAVDQWAARQLITLEALADALKWSDDREEVAEELWVTVDLLDVRLSHLHPSERAWIRRSLSE